MAAQAQVKEIHHRGLSPSLNAHQPLKEREMNGLESTGHTRTLRAIELPARLCDTGAAELRRALYVDCETTGLSVERDQAIEVALLPFTYAVDDGRIAEVCHDEAQCYLQDPGRPLDAIITDLTGLTDDDLRGQHIDVAAATTLIARSHLIVAHNARFDRPFLERALPATRAVPWACSLREVPWTAHGCPSAALHCLACGYGAFARERHRALADCEVGVWLLAQTLPDSDQRVMGALRENAAQETVRLWAAYAPIAFKDELKSRGYRWMPEMRHGIDRAWWTEVAPEMVNAELHWLRETIYPSGVLPHIPQRRVTAYDRWRADPSDVAGPAQATPATPAPFAA